jgi:hypothetical protein
MDQHGAKWKRLSEWYAFHNQRRLEGYSLRSFAKGLGWSKEDTNALLAWVREELEQKDLRIYSCFHLVTGKKSSNAAR